MNKNKSLDAYFNRILKFNLPFYFQSCEYEIFFNAIEYKKGGTEKMHLL